MSQVNDNNYTCVAYILGPQGTTIYLDNFRCFLAYFSVLLYHIQFGYICIALLIIIMFISIFGGIKENYRWFILNQTFWDLTISYRFICNNITAFSFFGINNSTCFYNFEIGYLKNFFEYSIDTNTYSALVLFSFTRLLGIYFPQKYKRLTQNRRIFYMLFIYNSFIVFTNIHSFFDYFARERKTHLTDECIEEAERKNSSDVLCHGEFDGDFQMILFKILFNIFSFIMFLKPMLCLLISFIAAILLIVRVAKQFKFQYKQNHKDLMASIRVCIVIFLQTLVNLFVFFIECTRNIQLFIANTFWITILTTKPQWDISACKNCVLFILPEWITGDYGLAYTPNLQAIVQFRIFIECLIVLFIMAGYRESIIQMFKASRKIFLNKIAPEITTAPVSSYS